MSDIDEREARKHARSRGWGFAVTDACGNLERQGGADLQRRLATSPEEGLRNLQELHALLKRFHPELGTAGMDRQSATVSDLPTRR